MKKMKRLLAFALALASLTLPAMAAGTHSTTGVYDLSVESGYTLTPLKADGSAADRYSGQFDGGVSTVYEGAEKFSLSFTGGDGQYVVFLLGDGGTVPTEGNIEYIDQSGGTSTIGFTLFPYQLEAGDYNVYVSSTGGDYAKVAGFSVTGSWEEAPYTLGDVNSDGRIDAVDALLALRHYAHLEQLGNTQQMAADVNADSKIDANDALKILRIYAKLEEGF